MFNLGNIIYTIITILIGAGLSFIITKFFYKSKKPRWCCKLIPLFSDGVSNIEHLNIQYQGKQATNLSIIYLVFWNNGTETIFKNYFLENIVFGFNNYDIIYDVNIIKTTNENFPGNGFEISVNENKKHFNLTFEKLGYKDGVLIQIVSDCTNIDNFKLQSGKISESDIVQAGKEHKYRNLLYLVFSAIWFIFVFFLYGLIRIWMAYDTGNLNVSDYKIEINILVIVSIILCIINVILIILLKKMKNWDRKVPKLFSTYFS